MDKKDGGTIARLALAEHDASDECFCDRMYPDSNPNASCGDCPTRDYAPQPPSIPEPSEADVDAGILAADKIYHALPDGVDEKTGKASVVRGVITTDRARLRERIGGAK